MNVCFLAANAAEAGSRMRERAVIESQAQSRDNGGSRVFSAVHAIVVTKFLNQHFFLCFPDTHAIEDLPRL